MMRPAYGQPKRQLVDDDDPALQALARARPGLPNPAKAAGVPAYATGGGGFRGGFQENDGLGQPAGYGPPQRETPSYTGLANPWGTPGPAQGAKGEDGERTIGRTSPGTFRLPGGAQQAPEDQVDLTAAATGDGPDITLGITGTPSTTWTLDQWEAYERRMADNAAERTGWQKTLVTGPDGVRKEQWVNVSSNEDRTWQAGESLLDRNARLQEGKDTRAESLLDRNARLQEGKDTRAESLLDRNARVQEGKDTRAESLLDRNARLTEQTQSEGFQRGESAADRLQRLNEQTYEHGEAARARTFAGTESAAEREAARAGQSTAQAWQSAEAAAGRTFGGAESAAERAASLDALLRTQSFQGGESAAGRGFAAGESAAERAQRTAELSQTQGFSGSQSALERAQRTAELSQTQGFSGSQSALERAQRTAELSQTQGFQGAEAERGRAFEDSQNTAERSFAGSESEKQRQASLDALLRTQGFQGSESAAGRSFAGAEAERGRAFEGGESAAGRNFAAGESAQERAQRSAELASTQSFAGGQANVDRTFRAGESAAERSQRLSEIGMQQGGSENLARLQASLQQDSEEARYARAQEESAAEQTRMDEILGRFGFGGGATPGGTPTGAAATPDLAADAEERAAESAIFGRAKDRIGQTTRAGLDSLAETMSARGIGGSGIEGDLQAQIIAGGQGEQGSVIADQAMEAVRRRQQLSDRNVSAGLTTRGQNIGLAQSLASLAKARGGGVY